jgi:hypothetical protein
VTRALRAVVFRGLDACGRGVGASFCFVGLFGFVDFAAVDSDAS